MYSKSYYLASIYIKYHRDRISITQKHECCQIYLVFHILIFISYKCLIILWQIFFIFKFISRKKTLFFYYKWMKHWTFYLNSLSFMMCDLYLRHFTSLNPTKWQVSICFLLHYCNNVQLLSHQTISFFKNHNILGLLIKAAVLLLVPAVKVIKIKYKIKKTRPKWCRIWFLLLCNTFTGKT